MNTEAQQIILIYIAIGLALFWALFHALQIVKVKLNYIPGSNGKNQIGNLPTQAQLSLVRDVGEKIQKGAYAFLFAEYLVMLIFIIIFGILILIVVDFYGSGSFEARGYATIAYVLGAITSMICGFVGMTIATATNYRTTYKCISSLEEGFQLAYQGGTVMGFFTIGFGMLVLFSLFLIYLEVFDPVSNITNDRSASVLMDLLAAFGLGASTMALFGRVGGGIYTKAADVGADLVGKVEHDLGEDSPRNPATIADNVGDNVGDIAGMGSDLFGSFASSTCATLVLIASQECLVYDIAHLYLPFMINAGGIVACFITSIIGIYVFKVNTKKRISLSLNLQLLIASVLTIIFLVGAVFVFPNNFEYIDNSRNKKEIDANRWYAFLAVVFGIVGGFFIGLSTDYFTSHHYYPVRNMAEACTSGTAINIIYGLALGYLSTGIPIIIIALIILGSMLLLGFLGVGLAAVGMLSTLCVELAIDAYGPISDNAGGISEMAELGEEVRDRTDALDAAGNTTAAIGKGFSIGSAALVAFALYGAFVTRVKVNLGIGDESTSTNTSGKEPENTFEIINPWVFSSLLVGAMLPYIFAALTMKSVGKAAQEMVQEVRRQFKNPDIKNGIIEPDYKTCIKVSTNASLKEMILPGLIVLIAPLFLGIIIHPITVVGLLPGALVSGVQLAISMSNSGGAWDNCKKYIEGGTYVNAEGIPKAKGSEEHKAAVVGDTIGDPFKDTSGPALNILIKLMAAIALVFAQGFDATSWLGDPFGIDFD